MKKGQHSTQRRDTKLPRIHVPLQFLEFNNIQMNSAHEHCSFRKSENMKTIVTLVGAATIMLSIACGSDTAGVASLERVESTPVVRPTEDSPREIVEGEAEVMAFTQCMRDQGIEVKDPVVDADGNLQRPEPIEGAQLTIEDLRPAFEACQQHLEGMTFGRERPDVSEIVDQLIELTSCLRDKGYEVDDPTAEELGQWRGNFRTQFDFDDPDAVEAYEACNPFSPPDGGGPGGRGGRGGPG